MPTNREIQEFMFKLDLPAYMIGGTATLQLRGIVPDNSVPDVDIVTSDDIFELLSFPISEGWIGCTQMPKEEDGEAPPSAEIRSLSKGAYCILPISNFLYKVDAVGYVMRAETVMGLKCLKVEDLLHWKKAINRPKDQAHIELIEEWMRVNYRLENKI